MLLLERSRNLKGLFVCRASLSGNSPVRLLSLQSRAQSRLIGCHPSLLTPCRMHCWAPGWLQPFAWMHGLCSDLLQRPGSPALKGDARGKRISHVLAGRCSAESRSSPHVQI